MKKLHVLLLIGLLCSTGCTQVKPPPSELLGKWEEASNLEGIEFNNDGTLTIVRDQEPPLTGKYRILEASLLEVDLRPTVKEPIKVKMSIDGQELTLNLSNGSRADSKVEAATTWKRVPDWALAARTVDAAASEQRRLWLIGHWQASTDNETYDFYEDRTFACHTDSSQSSVSLGTYALAKDSAHAIVCRYPDTGATTSLHVSVTQEELLVGRENPECPLALLRMVKKYRAAGSPNPDYRPVRVDALTAYQLYDEWQTDPVAAEKKYKGKEVQIVGMVRSHSSSSVSASFADEDGKPIRQDSAVTKLFLVTGAGQNVLCLFDGRANQEQIGKLLREKGDREKPRKPFVIKGQCVGVTDDQGKDVVFKVTVDGDTPKLRLDHCVLVEDAPPK
jgi:hypothetical protein